MEMSALKNTVSSLVVASITSVIIAIPTQASAYDFCQIVSDRVSQALTATKSKAENSDVDLGGGVFNIAVSSYINDFIKENGREFDPALIELNEEYVYQSCVESMPTLLKPTVNKKSGDPNADL